MSVAGGIRPSRPGRRTIPGTLSRIQPKGNIRRRCSYADGDSARARSDATAWRGGGARAARARGGRGGDPAPGDPRRAADRARRRLRRRARAAPAGRRPDALARACELLSRRPPHRGQPQLGGGAGPRGGARGTQPASRRRRPNAARARSRPGSGRRAARSPRTAPICSPAAPPILTHCNTGALAAPGEGTALAVIAELARRGTLDGVLVTESRPLLQGARLTVYELRRLGIAHELIVDSAAAGLLAAGAAQAVIVGCDRVAANGDVANKVGTLSLALAALRRGDRVLRRRSGLDPRSRLPHRRGDRDRGAAGRGGRARSAARRSRCRAPPAAIPPSTSPRRN